MENTNVCKFNFNRSSDLICKDFVYETCGRQSKPKRSPHHSINLTVGGSGVFVCGGNRYSICAGSMFFVPEGEIFAVMPETDLKYCYVSFHGRRGDEYIQRLGICAANCVFSGCGSLIPFWLDSSKEADAGNIDFLCEAVLLYSLSKLKPDQKNQSSVINSMVMLTQKRFSDFDLSVSLIAEELGYSEKYLSSLFKKRMGIPFTRYLQEIRLKHAIFLMEEGVVSVKNVALLSGFRDPLYFSRIFSKSEGISPKQYMLNISNRK